MANDLLASLAASKRPWVGQEQSLSGCQTLDMVEARWTSLSIRDLVRRAGSFRIFRPARRNSTQCVVRSLDYPRRAWCGTSWILFEPSPRVALAHRLDDSKGSAKVTQSDKREASSSVQVTALIVGGGPGISSSCARLFAENGMRVGVAARNPETGP